MLKSDPAQPSEVKWVYSPPDAFQPLRVSRVSTSCPAEVCLSLGPPNQLMNMLENTHVCSEKRGGRWAHTPCLSLFFSLYNSFFIPMYPCI